MVFCVCVWETNKQTKHTKLECHERKANERSRCKKVDRYVKMCKIKLHVNKVDKTIFLGNIMSTCNKNNSIRIS